MKVLLTGATGFLGRHLQPELVRIGCDVMAVGRDFLRISNAAESADAIIHLAAQTQVSKAVEDPESTWEGNVRGTWRVLEFARQHKIKRVIIASTDKAYGRSTAPYFESTPLTPDRPYETSKACADMIARTYVATYGMFVAVTRCVNLYGPGHLNFSTLIPGTIRRVLKGERPIIRNGGRMKRDFLFVEDAVDGYVKLLGSNYSGPVNFGTGIGHSIGDVSRTIIKLMGSDLTPIDEPDKNGEIVDQWSNYSIATMELNWRPKHTLEDGLKKTIAWYREHLK